MEIDNKRLVIGLTLIFILGILFAIVNGYYTAQMNEQLPLIVYSISFISILIGSLIVLLFQWKISHHQVKSILKILPREERLLTKTLLENKNMMEQNKIVVLTGLSKVQVSRTIQKLTERGVIEKRDMGNTNLVILKL